MTPPHHTYTTLGSMGSSCSHVTHSLFFFSYSLLFRMFLPHNGYISLFYDGNRLLHRPMKLITFLATEISARAKLSDSSWFFPLQIHEEKSSSNEGNQHLLFQLAKEIAYKILGSILFFSRYISMVSAFYSTFIVLLHYWPIVLSAFMQNISVIK